MRPVAVAFLLSAVLAGCGDDGGSSSSRAQTAPASQVASVALTGRVLLDGVPAEGAVLVVSSVDTGLVPDALDPESMFTDATGAFRMELAPGNYRVLAVGPDRSEASLDVELSADSDPVELTLATDPKHVQDFLQNGPRFERSEDAQ